ncbi:hypothetical protein Mapa_010402 [Marchantia paleacea]|nr:hypothetical protein Mapa_010402 [Marchantia paleacea]
MAVMSLIAQKCARNGETTVRTMPRCTHCILTETDQFYDFVVVNMDNRGYIMESDFRNPLFNHLNEVTQEV